MSNTNRPTCRNCTHLKEDYTSLWCDIPNGNRKASKDVGGCDNYKAKKK